MNGLTVAVAMALMLLGVGALDRWLGVSADGIAIDLLIVSTVAFGRWLRPRRRVMVLAREVWRDGGGPFQRRQT